jgi:hypothetical protein
VNFEFSRHWNKPTTKSQSDKLIDLALEANLEGRSAETPDTSNLSLDTYCDHRGSCVMSGQEGTEEPRTSIYFCRTMISTLGPVDPSTRTLNKCVPKNRALIMLANGRMSNAVCSKFSACTPKKYLKRSVPQCRDRPVKHEIRGANSQAHASDFGTIAGDVQQDVLH